jgi:DNA primase
MSVIDDIKARVDAVELISETVKLRKSGRTFTGLCPFHAHKNNTPSFAVWPDSGNWKCFGQCNEGGDIFKFVMKRDGVDFAEALRVLALRAGVELKPRTPEEQEQDEVSGRLRQALDAAALYYHHLLKNAPQAAHARAHLQQRGLTDKASELFQLGYSLDGWDGALTYLTGKGFTQKELLEVGLIVEKDEGKVFDRFRDRLMIPVHDDRGRMTGFQARALKADALPKFMNSPQTALFDKGRTLFGLHLARKPIRDAGAAIVVEGNLDVIAAHQAGFTNVVSSQGTALTEHQLRLLKKHAKRIILALDADAAGDAATLRGLSVAREALDRETEITFDPRGLVKTEGRLGADIRVMTLPPGLDPDDVIKRSPDEWRTLTEAAEPVVEYVIRVLTTGRNLDDPKVKTEIAEAVLPMIEDVAEPIERDTYRQKLARVLKVDERSLAVKRPGAKRREAPVTPARAADSAPAAGARLNVSLSADQPAARAEAYCLSLLLRDPDLLYKADRELQSLSLPKLSTDDFSGTDYQLIFQTLLAAHGQVEADAHDYLRAQIDPVLRPALDELLARAPGAALPDALSQKLAGFKHKQPDTLQAADDLISAVLQLRQRAEQRRKSELYFLLQDAQDNGDREAEDTYQKEMQQRALTAGLVDKALARRAKHALPAPQHLG